MWRDRDQLLTSGTTLGAVHDDRRRGKATGMGDKYHKVHNYSAGTRPS
jgi:hypothetical protein